MRADISDKKAELDSRMSDLDRKIQALQITLNHEKQRFQSSAGRKA